MSNPFQMHHTDEGDRRYEASILGRSDLVFVWSWVNGILALVYARLAEAYSNHYGSLGERYPVAGLRVEVEQLSRCAIL